MVNSTELVPKREEVFAYLDEIEKEVPPSRYRVMVVEKFKDRIQSFYNPGEATMLVAHSWILDWIQEKYHKDRDVVEKTYLKKWGELVVDRDNQLESLRQQHIESWNAQFPWNVDSPLEFSEKLPKDCDDCED